MARGLGKLSARSVATVVKKGRYADGGGLYLQVTATASKSWLYRYMRHGRARQMGIGPYPLVSLAEARAAAAACRKQLFHGVDPLAARTARRTQARIDAAKGMTFKECAEAYITANAPGWKNAKHAAQWGSTLATYVYPVFGAFPVAAVDTALVLTVVEPIWTTKTETASRVRGRIESVLDWAAARQYRAKDNPARWKGHLDKILPARSKVRAVKHHAALSYAEIGGFMAELRRHEGAGARGLEFQILTACRSGEVMGARWDEIDLERGFWTIPSGRMKAGKEHRVPLSPAARAVLEEMAKVRSSDFVFAGMRAGRPLSNMAFTQLLKRMGRGDLTAHGFRSSFRDWAAEQTAFPHEVCEMALAHAVGNKVEAAYRRGDLLDKRVKIMEAWAAYCVVPAA